ncbi:beta-ketoacyl synthase N-terminal-like domain-containing protein [Massilia sp. YMA4]|uniref:beta-ketoacyl synthase N-terminal-like domain-containing protein n=1 Tax=Massilia sp. YMA4 TaxID=1593482 RepID=UPI00187894B4|nr:beta-ketoacyl synthase N-terminal-like domain-containing protein [Massilia sp. YMA4]
MTGLAQMDHRIAVIGTALALPGADSLAGFERMTFDAADAFSAPPGAAAAGENWVDRAAYLDDWSGFDYRLFGLSLRDSVIIDPQQRLFLQHCWKAIEAAGYNPMALPGRGAVFSTASDSDFVQLARAAADDAGNYHPFEIEIGSNKEQQALRVSHVLNLRGPSFGVQSACSSGLLVLHTAMQSLALRDCDVALAGGACLPLPLHQGYEYRPGMNLSRSGVIRSFDQDADGMVPGFGCVVFVLKRLEDAVSDRDPILAVLAASAVNNDGSNKASYVAPSSSAVAENLQALLRKGGLEPGAIDFVEAHGSGTYIGDVIEAAALRQVFRASSRAAGGTAVASAKASVGHLDTVAGLVGLLRTIVQIGRGSIAPAANFSVLNPRISFDGTPLFVPTAAVPVGQPLSAIVNALGIGGTNCALLVQSAPPAPAAQGAAGAVLPVRVGASSEERLRAAVARAGAALASTQAGFEALVFTLNRRARGKPFVAHFAAADAAALAAQLAAFDGAALPVSAPEPAPGPGPRAVDLGWSEIDPQARVGLPQAAAVAAPAAAADAAADAAQRLRAIWQSALLLQDVTPQTSFRDAGGHSMLALTMLDDINGAFGTQHDLDWIDQHDRFDQQLAALDAPAGPAQAGRLVKLVRAAQGTPRLRLVLVHASISGYETYRPLAAQLAPDIELLAIDSHNLYADEGQLIRDGAELAALYASQLRAALPERSVPLCLGGWSLGGMLADLMAPLLAPHYRLCGTVAIDSVVYRDEHAALFADSALAYFMDQGSLLAERFEADQLQRQARRLQQVFAAERAMARAFVPGSLGLPFLNIVAIGTRKPLADAALLQAFDRAKNDNGWRRQADEPIVRIDADHVQIVDPAHLAMIALHINRFTRSACTTTSS